MRFFLKLAAILMVCVAVAALALHLLVPPDLVRERVAAAVKEETGRTLTVAGDASLSVWPTLGVELTDVTLSDPPGMADGETLRMESLNLDLALLPLLGREIAVNRFVLTRPIINLRRDAEGRPNWRFGRPQGAEIHRRRGIAAQSDGGGETVRRLTLSDVRVIDGTVNFADAATGARYMTDAVNLNLVMPAPDAPLDAAGSLRWKGETVTLDAKLSAPQALRGGQNSPLTLALKAPSLEAGFNGDIAAGDAMRFEGELNASSPSVRSLLDWLGDGAPAREGFGAAQLSGRLSGEAGQYALKQAKLSFDGMHGQGQAVISTQGARPHLRAALALDRLIVDPYLSGPPPERRADSPQRKRPIAAQTAGDDPLTGFIDRLEDDPSADDIAPPQESQESPAPAQAPQDIQPALAAPAAEIVEAKGLRALDADINLNVASIAVKRIKIGKSVVEAKLRDGVLDANLKETALYDGKGAGTLRYDGRTGAPDLAAKLSLDNVSALPLLQDAAQFAWISGRAKIDMALTGRGRNGEEMTQSLNGNGAVRFTDGAIEGFNLPQMVRALKQGDTDWQSQERVRTDFSELSGSFTMANGVASTEDINLASPLLRVTATGDIDLPRKWLDLQAKPTIVPNLEGQGGGAANLDGESGDPANLEGQGGAAAAGGIMVPFDIEGPWDRPSFRPDFKRLLDDPDATAQTLGALREQLKGIKGRDVGRMLDGLLGTRPAEGEPGADGEAGAPGEQERVKPRDLLKQFLR